MLYAGSYDSAGRLVRSYAASLPEHLAAMVAGETLPVAEASAMLAPHLHWRDGGEWALRPAPPAPPALVAGSEVVWSGLPVGAIVTIKSLLSGAQAGTDTAGPSGTVPIRLAAGPWRIEVSEVFPHLPAVFEIEVPEA